jgi:NAD(P)-dependent dehydrogenase (short-subunit alcohol dehydrogenase family)
LYGAGARVVAFARRAERLHALADELPGVIPVVGDLQQWDDLERLVSAAHEDAGPVDILVNTAAAPASPAPAQDESRDGIERTLMVNLVAPFRLSQLVFPDMRARNRGCIVNIASISGMVGIGRIPQASYAASKAALAGLTRELAAQWSRYGIRVNAIAPGFFKSEMTEPIYEQPKLEEWLQRNTLLGRHGTAADVGGALLYLTSDASDYVTGSTLVVDGGWTAR